jgi:hypothetical protein
VTYLSSVSLSSGAFALNSAGGKAAATRRSLSTPIVLKLLLGAVALAAAVMAIVCWMSVRSTESSINAIGREAVPAIITAQEVRSRLVEMDASAANEFLGGGQAARGQYETARARLSVLLTAAANHNGAGVSERQAIQGMVEQVQVYSGLIETARSNSRQGFPVGSAYLRFASNLMHSQIMPAADNLDKINSDYLEAQYAGQVRMHYLALGGAITAGLVLLAVLGSAQIFLSRRMKRRFNPCLLVASVMVTGFLAVMGTAMVYSSSQLSQAKEGDFVSLHALWQARALAYDAKADQSLYLVMRGNGQKYETGFAEKAKVLSGKMQDAAALSLTAVGDAAVAAASRDLSPAFATFVGLQDTIRQLDKGGDRQKAVATATGSGADQSNGSFARFDQAMSTVVDGQKAHFDGLVDNASAAVAWMHLIGLLIAVIAIGLTWTGLRPRLNEYRI